MLLLFEDINSITTMEQGLGLPKVVDPPGATDEDVNPLVAETDKDIESPQPRVEKMAVVSEPSLAQNDNRPVVESSVATDHKSIEINNQLPATKNIDKLEDVEPSSHQNKGNLVKGENPVAKDFNLDHDDPVVAKPDDKEQVQSPVAVAVSSSLHSMQYSAL